jgi:hypothetical protein
MSPDTTTPSRRAFLATSATAIVTATAGCTALFDLIGEQFLEDVNVFNETGKRIEGSVTVTGPSGDKALEEQFELQPTEETAETENQSGSNAAFYADVWTDSGNYDVSVTLSSAVDGVSEATETVRIDDPDEEMLAIPLGADDVEEPIGFRVATEFSEFSTPS